MKNSTKFAGGAAVATTGVGCSVASVTVGGSTAIALGEYLRDNGFKIEGKIEILQGFDMKKLSQLFVSFTAVPNSSIKVSGTSRVM